MIIVAFNLVPEVFNFNFVFLEAFNQDGLLSVLLVSATTTLSILCLTQHFEIELQAELLELSKDVGVLLFELLDNLIFDISHSGKIILI